MRYVLLNNVLAKWLGIPDWVIDLFNGWAESLVEYMQKKLKTLVGQLVNWGARAGVSGMIDSQSISLQS